MDLSIAAWAVFLFAASIAARHPLHPHSDEFISAGGGFPPGTSLAYIKKLMGVLKDPNPPVLPSKVHDPELIASLPENFDPREKWPNCPSLNEIRDQAGCGSCWAMGAVEAMTDRVCIYSNGTKNFHFSAQDLTSCSPDPNHGCDGGIPIKAWNYWKDTGIVSGGPYNSSQGCRPYEIPPDHRLHNTPPCVKKCRDGYGVKYDQDKHFGKNVYTIKGEDNIKAELYSNGPVEAAFDVYQDFITYNKSSIYNHTSGELLGGHAIKLMGWGVQDGMKYWLCANSWGTHWGVKGFFKILRGEDTCGIEDDIVAGEPALDR